MHLHIETLGLSGDYLKIGSRGGLRMTRPQRTGGSVGSRRLGRT